MDLLKATIYILVIMMGVNAISLMMTTVGMSTITPYNTSQVEGAFNASEIVDSWGWGDNAFYDIGTGLLGFWFRTVPLIEAFPEMLSAYGCPVFIYIPIHSIWRFMWIGALALGIIAGRQT